MGPKKLRKRKKLLSINQKIEICNCLDMGVNRRYLMKKFDVSASTLSLIKSQKAELLNSLSTSDADERCWLTSSVRRGKLNDVEDALFEWYTAVRSEHSKVSSSMIIEKAKSLNKQMNIGDQYSFSSGWLHRFKLRYGIGRNDLGSYEIMNDPVFCGASQMYCDFFGTLVAEHDLYPEQIYSACEIRLFWRCLHESDQRSRGKPGKDSLIGEQEKLSVFLCANASGRHKVNVFAVGEDELKSPKINGCSVEYSLRKDGVMDEASYIMWFEKIFVPSVKLNLQNSGKPENSQVLLLLDSCAQDILNSELVCDNIFSVFLPKNVSSILLPINKGVAHDFKCNYKIDVMKKICRQEMSVQYFLSQYSIDDVIVYLQSAWESVSQEVLRKSWLHLLSSP